MNNKTESVIVLIDDERTFKEKVSENKHFKIITYKNSKDAIEGLSKLITDDGVNIMQVWFDHDLGEINGVPDSTFPVVEMLEMMFHNGETLGIGHFIIHTANNSAAPRLQKALENLNTLTTRINASEYLYAN